MADVLLPEKVSAFERDGQKLVAEARAIVVTNQEQYDEAGAWLNGVSRLKKEIEEFFREPIEHANQTHKTLTSRRAAMLKGPEEARAQVKKVMGDWQLAEERRRREIAAQEEARRRKEEEDKLVARAQEMEAAGNPVQAAAVLDLPVTTQPVASTKVKGPAGVSSRRGWKFEITDASKIAREFLVVDERAIQKTVDSLGKRAESIVGGITVSEKITIAG